MASKYNVTLSASDKTKAAFDAAKKNANSLETEYGKVRKAANDIGKAVAGLATVAVGSAALFTKATLDQAAEIERLSALTNIASDDFQKYAVGAKLAGVEQDKLADIFKDTSDKIGDFLQTGGGPLKDFFDNVAPQIGVTAEQFRNLSGPQALELYVSSLQKANVSSNEMTFFMEAIASDAALLLPLLKDNADGFKTMGDQAEAAGAIMSNNTIKAAQELSAVMILMDQSTEGFKNQVRDGTLPVIKDLALTFYKLSESELVADGASDLINGSIKGITSTALGAFAVIQLLGKGLGGLAAIVATGGDAYEIVVEDLKSTIQEYGSLLDDISEAGTGEVSDEKLQSIIDLQAKIRESIGQATSGANLSINQDDKTEIDKAKQSLDTLNQSLKQQADTAGFSSTKLLEYRLTVGDLSNEVKRLGSNGNELTSSILENSKALETAKAAVEATKKAEEDRKKILEEGKALTQAMLTPMEAYIEKLKEIDDLADSSAISEETAVRARKKAFDEMKDKTKDTTDEMTKFIERAAESMQESMSDLFFDVMQGNLSDFGDNFKKTIDRIVADMLASQILNWAIGDFGGTGEIGGVVGKLFEGFGGARAEGGPVTGGTPYLVGERGPELIIPKSSGTVIPNNQLSGGSITVNQHITIQNADRSTAMAAGRSMAQQATAALTMAQRQTARNT